MSPFVAWCDRHFNLRRTVIGLTVILGAGMAQAEPARPIQVVLDQAKIIKLPERTTTLVVGNPLIADVSVQAGGTLVITGKSYGITNLVALDRAGQTLLEHSIEVQGPTGNVVVVYRGIERETYACTPNCERRITLGDTTNHFTAALTQTGTLNTTAAQSLQPK